MPVSFSPEIYYISTSISNNMILARCTGGVTWWFHCLACACLRCFSGTAVVPLSLSGALLLVRGLSSGPLASERFPRTGCDIGDAERFIKSFKFKISQIQPFCPDALSDNQSLGTLPGECFFAFSPPQGIELLHLPGLVRAGHPQDLDWRSGVGPLLPSVHCSAGNDTVPTLQRVHTRSVLKYFRFLFLWSLWNA